MGAGPYGAVCYNGSLEEGRGKTLTVQNSTLRDNVAYSTSVFTKGGGIYAGDGLASVSLDQLMMVNNSADYGGAVFITGNYDVNIRGSEFSGNTGMYGTYRSRQSPCFALHCTFAHCITSCSAESDAGTMFSMLDTHWVQQVIVPSALAHQSSF